MTDLYLKELAQYSNGTDCIYLDRSTGIKYSNGVRYIAANGYAWFVTDALAVIKLKPKVRMEPFLTIKLNLLPSNKAEMTIDDGGKQGSANKILHRQHYDYTDAKVELTLFYENNLLLLPSER